MLKRSNDGFGFKWNMTISLTIIPVVVVMITIFFMLTSNYVVKLSEDNLKLHSEICADKLSSWMERIEGELGVYKKTIEDNFPDEKGIVKYARQTYNVHKDYPIGLYIGDDSGKYMDGAGWIPGDDWILTERPWYVNAKNSYEFVFTEPYIDAMYNKPCISISARIRYPKAIRVMATDVYLDYADNLISEIAAEKNNIDGALFVTEENRIVVSNSTDRYVGKSLNDDSNAISKAICKLLNKRKIGQTTTRINGKTYYVNIKQMDITEWYLVTYVQKNTILKGLHKMQRTMIIIALLGAAILIVITRAYARQMSYMNKKAKTDKLTKVLNREGFEEQVHNILSEYPQQGIMLIVDMDNFKLVNDNLGHPAGDKVLVKFAKLLESFFNRKQDVVARIGGDEFAVFVGGDVNKDNMQCVLNRFMVKMKESFREEYADYNLTASIGGAFVKERNQYLTLYKSADENLYKTKKKGKNGFTLN